MRWIDRLAIGIGRVTGWAFPVIALMMGYEVVARYAFGAPTIWAHEIAGLIAAIAFIFGGATCMADRSHMRVTLLVDRARGGVRRAAELLSLLCGVIFLAGLAFAMFDMLDRSLFRFAADGTWRPERSGSSWNTPAPAFLKFALFLGATLFLLVVIRQALHVIRGGAPDGSDEDVR